MRLRRWCLGLALLTLVPMNGCARLNEWLEGTVGEEKKKEGPTPEEELANQQTALADPTKPADRKAAIGKLMGLKRPDALDVVIKTLGDSDPAVNLEVLSHLQSATGFAEKTEDERQLDPEGYKKQLDFKTKILTDAVDKLAGMVEGRDRDAAYSALVVLYNFTRPPVVPADAKTTVGQKAAGVLTLALDRTADEDARVLAMETLTALGAGQQVAQLVALLDEPSEVLRSQAIWSLGAAAGSLGEAGKAAADKLAIMASDATATDGLRWRALLALARLSSAQTAPADRKFEVKVDESTKGDLSASEKISGMETYRTFALANCTSPEAAQKLAAENADLHKIAAAAEEELAAERKKGYR